MSAQPIAIRRAPASEPRYEPVHTPHLYLVHPSEQLQFPDGSDLLPEERDSESVDQSVDQYPGYDRDFYARQAVEAQLPGALENYFGPQHTSTAVLPDITGLATTYCRAVAEILTGFRSPGQVRANSAAPVMEWITRRVAELAPNKRRPLAPVVSCVRVCEPADGVAEVSAVVRHGPRARAMAARFQGVDGLWRCVHLQII